jgi:nitroimidazol reductase NimA-like FMN-containing flavoprotein (pyridoxamine 5'-phosphate oxidase superfamily)
MTGAGMTGAPVTGPRTAAQRRADTEHRLTHDVDAWVATADDGDTPRLTPLSFRWDGSTLLLATPVAGPTGRNLAANRTVQLGIGLTRDVVLVQGTVEVVPRDSLSAEEGDAFATKTGFDPRTIRSEYAYYRVRPTTVQAWREEDELGGRWLMRDGVWLV